MADPFTIGLTIAAAGMQAVGQIFQGQAASQAADYNAQVAEQNAARARTDAAARVEKSVRDSRRVLGAQRAGIAQSGFGFGGSFGDLMERSEVNADLDALTLAYEGEAAGRGYQNQANLKRAEADNAMTAGYLGAATSLLSSGSKAYGQSRGFGLTV